MAERLGLKITKATINILFKFVCFYKLLYYEKDIETDGSPHDGCRYDVLLSADR